MISGNFHQPQRGKLGFKTRLNKQNIPIHNKNCILSNLTMHTTSQPICLSLSYIAEKKDTRTKNPFSQNQFKGRKKNNES